MPDNNLTLFGNDSQHVVFFTETEVGLGKATVSGLNGGVHLLKDFFENLTSGKPVENPVAELKGPHSSIELFKDKKNERSFRVQRQLHIRDPSLKHDTITGSTGNGNSTTVLLLEDPVLERDHSTEEISKLFTIVNDLQDKVLVCKISRPLSKKYRINFLEVLGKKVNNLEELKIILKETLLLNDEIVAVLNGWDISSSTTVMKALQVTVPATITANGNWKWLKELQEKLGSPIEVSPDEEKSPPFSIKKSLEDDLSQKKATANDKDLLEELQNALSSSRTATLERVITGLRLEDARMKDYVTDNDLSQLLEGKKVKADDGLLGALKEILTDIKVLARLAEAADKPLSGALLKKYTSLKFPPVIIVDARDLRKEGVQLSYHLSWSKTVEEFKQFLSGDSLFAKDLKDFTQKDKAPHLIVRFGCDGVIHCKADKPNELSLYYANSKFVEGDYVQQISGEMTMTGEATAFTAGLVHKLAGDANLNMEAAISYGMKAACRLVSKGFERGDLGFKYPDISKDHLQISKPLTIDTARISDAETGRWSILTMNDTSTSGPSKMMLSLAKRIVKSGTDKSLEQKPSAQFGDLVTVDREEMENFRRIANLVQDYMKTTNTKPLSIGVFGSPGSGKSFGVGQVIKEVATRQGKEIEKLEFNLSQFLEYSDLLAAFQSIRDRTFTGKVPVVMFDEFDCSFGGKALGWLQYFLAPMQDGKFLERGQLRPLGSAIFIFVGGTSPTFGEFQATARERDAVAAKKPDFVSRLRGSVDIWGPNKLSSRDDGDKTYTVRRAIILRSLLKKNKFLDQKGEFKVADNVLNALLCVSGFHHGTRSLEAIVNMCQITPGQEFTAAGLPSDDRLTPYTDPIEFGEWLKSWRVRNEEKRKHIEQAIYKEYQGQAGASQSWEPNWEETMLLSKAVAENISNFLDASKASDLTKWQQPAKPEAAAKAGEAKGDEAKKDEAKKDKAKEDEAKKDETKKDETKEDEEKAAEEKEKKIKKIAEGVYYLHKAIRSNRRTTVEMIMPWWFIEQQTTPRNRYFKIADVVWQALTARPESPPPLSPKTDPHTSESSSVKSSPSGSTQKLTPPASPDLKHE
ncbi:hypothetical protein BDV41DRAFT_388598 [Aspergillus transmontanensis]|uniref:ATPase AAA-type core domain-containing protein n=1 Tax=Aspergillus transmontanensis TaxID=1034304 RepID=A0A5N6VTJ3_9EURO|nr:hypothetical protein BDV41DRAFT_388598 [Aspergillus transmontanensis]